MNTYQRLERLLKNKGLTGFLARGFLGSGGLKVAHALLSLALSILLARELGAEGYGIYAYAFSIATLLAIPAQMGLPTLMVREIARFQLNEQWNYIKGLLRRSNQLIALNSIILLAGAAIYISLKPATNPDKLLTILYALALVPLIALGNLRGATLRGLRKVIQGQLPEQVLRPTFFILLILATLLLTQELTPPDAMLLHGIASLLTFIVGIVLLLKSLPAPVKIATAAFETKSWFYSLLPLSFISGMQVINSQADIFMLGLMASDEDVGIYRVAVQGANLVAFALTAVNTVIAPQITRLYHAGDMIKLQRMVTISARLILAVSLPIGLTFIFFGEPILRLVFGTEFSSGSTALAILCVGQLVNAAMGSVGFLLNMTGHEHETAKGMMIAATSNIILNLLLIPIWGIEGAAIATSTSLSIWNILLCIKAWKCLRINSLAINYTRDSKE